MQVNFKDLFASCERSIALLEQLLPDAVKPSRNEWTDITIELLPLLADLGDFADECEIDDGPLCEARTALLDRIATQHKDDLDETLRRAIHRVRRIRAAIHIEGHRRLRAALLGL